MNRINFELINRAALAALPILLRRWLPDGHQRGREWLARNPTRDDRSLGSFSINTSTGRWADFADRDGKGGDIVSLYAYLRNIGQAQAARELADLLRIHR
ncbi:hypothetical protein [Bradyrhizobium neotropicale]|uniref:hypothetical protein n=1 Tax=Bradyrhizobium neotropicale TaxID=1497615 RepID=UPI001AD7D151|nr:hypothetical protein [Bradyrhizobium neotropicale]MBO4224725.1 hypothetical protein [Bradyrhizobium neotropicale]